ncbi:unnamed protein product [Coffea canephora]|uniref:Major facilitator superfamily (MFS) profile domain-containing protein n=1 Tax=Coffea canephora TaxID=49390 RepID=A0A068UR10_COFCA|nr:unnamed protein product [Coffea canephora]
MLQRKGIGMATFLLNMVSVPTELRCLGLSFYHGATGIGSFFSSFLASAIDKATSQNGRESWFSDNLNRAHLDYFYSLLAGLGVVGLISFFHLAKSYTYSQQNGMEKGSEV